MKRRSPLLPPSRPRGLSKTGLGAAALIVMLALYVFGQRKASARSVLDFVVIVNPNNPSPRLNRDFLIEAFLKRTTRWGDGEALRPVDQRFDTTVRRAFSQSVLQRSAEAVKNYWQQRIFSGRDLPPPELASDNDVIAYVLQHRGAVGYVSRGASLDRAKPVSVE